MSETVSFEITPEHQQTTARHKHAHQAKKQQPPQNPKNTHKTDRNTRTETGPTTEERRKRNKKKTKTKNRSPMHDSASGRPPILSNQKLVQPYAHRPSPASPTIHITGVQRPNIEATALVLVVLQTLKLTRTARECACEWLRSSDFVTFRVSE